MISRIKITLLLTGMLTFYSCKHLTSHTYVPSSINHSYMISTVLEDTIEYFKYTPPNIDVFGKINIIYLLHGHGGSEDDWISENEGHIQYILDSLINNNLIPQAIAVTFNAGNSWYVDGKEKMEQFFIEEWIPFVDGIILFDSIDSRIIAGNSAGGYGTLKFSLKYPDLFDASLLLSPAAYYPAPPAISSSRKIDVFNDEDGFSDEVWQAYSYHNILFDASDNIRYPKFYLSTGDDDEYDIVNVVIQLQEFLSENQFEHELTIVNGGHSWDVWRERFAHDLVRAYEDFKTE